QTASVHRCEHLHIANRMQPEALRNALSHDTQQLGLDCFRTVRRNDIEVTLAFFAHDRELALIHAVRIDNDLRGRCLAKNFCERDRRKATRTDNVCEYGTWSHGRKLIDITDEEDGGVIWNGAEQLRHQYHIHHRDLIDDDQVCP